jgi:hypothetical protein
MELLREIIAVLTSRGIVLVGMVCGALLLYNVMDELYYSKEDHYQRIVHAKARSSKRAIQLV